jgi:hypothetical protein
MISDQPEYTSNKQFDPDHHLDGLFLVCSDGRFEEHANDFREHLRQTLGLRKLDRYFMPGSQLQFASAETGHPAADKATDYWTGHHLGHPTAPASSASGYFTCSRIAVWFWPRRSICPRA